MPTTRAAKMPNLGDRSWRMLDAAGIRSESALRALGAVEAFARVERAGVGASLNLLWALEGALSGRHWREVARTDRASLLLRLDDRRRAGAAAPGGGRP